MGTWNYRVVQTKDTDGSPLWGLYEVYYDDTSNPVARTQNPISFGGYDNLADLRTDLEYAFRGLDRLVLNDDVFEKEFDGES